MPQISQFAESWYAASQIFWVLLTFGFVFFIIGRGMLPKIEATVDARDRKVADDLAAAESEIGAARTSAMAEIEAVAAEAAGDLVAKLSGVKIATADAKAAVKAVLHG